jgi:hypothetical protein
MAGVSVFKNENIYTRQGFQVLSDQWKTLEYNQGMDDDDVLSFGAVKTRR